MPESKRRKPKRPKPQTPHTIVVKDGVRYLKMRDENGKRVLRPLPTNDKENDT